MEPQYIRDFIGGYDPKKQGWPSKENRRVEAFRKWLVAELKVHDKAVVREGGKYEGWRIHFPRIGMYWHPLEPSEKYFNLELMQIRAQFECYDTIAPNTREQA